MSKPQFTELAKAQIQPTRLAVISKANETSDNQYTLGQYVNVEEGTRCTTFFVKGGIQIKTLNNLIALRDALSEAITKESEK